MTSSIFVPREAGKVWLFRAVHAARKYRGVLENIYVVALFRGDFNEASELGETN